MKKILILCQALFLTACVTTNPVVENTVLDKPSPMDVQINKMGSRIEKLLITLSRKESNCSFDDVANSNLSTNHPLMQVVNLDFQGDARVAIEKLAEQIGVKSQFVGKHLVALPNVIIHAQGQKAYDVLELISTQMGVNSVEITYIEDERLIEIKSIGRADKANKKTKKNSKQKGK